MPLSYLDREVQVPRALRIRVSNGPCSPPEHGQKPRFALRTLRMIGHFPDPDLLVKVSTLEAEQVDRLRREVKAHSIEDFLPLRLRGDELRYLHVPTEDRIRERSAGRLRPMNDDLDFSRANLVNDLADSVEICVEQEGLSDRLVVDRRVREANLQGPQVSLADGQAAADRSEPLRDPLHVISEREMVLQQRLQTAFQCLVVDPKQAVDKALDVDLAGVCHELVQDPIGVCPPEPDEVLPGEHLLDQVAEGDVDDLAEGRVDDQEAVERFHEDAIVRGDRRAGLPVVRMFLDEALHRGLVHRPRLLEEGDRFGDPVLLDTMVDFLPDPSHALGEAEWNRQHFAIPAGDQGVRVRDRGHVHHAVLADSLDLPGTAADDEMQALPRLDHHELLAEDADLLLGREVHDLVAALVADRGEVLEVVSASFRGHADLVPLLAQDPEVVEELRDAVRRRVLEFAVRLGGSDGRQDLRPGGRAALVGGAPDDLLG